MQELPKNQIERWHQTMKPTQRVYVPLSLILSRDSQTLDPGSMSGGWGSLYPIFTHQRFASRRSKPLRQIGLLKPKPSFN